MERARVGLQQAIRELRSQLEASIKEASKDSFRFEVGEIILELEIEVESNTDSSAGVNFYLFDLHTAGASRNTKTHKVTIPLKPITQEGKAVYTGSDAPSDFQKPE